MATLVAKGIWQQEIDDDVVIFWLEADGLHSKRTSKNLKIGEHAEQVMSFTDALAKSEHQLTLPV